MALAVGDVIAAAIALLIAYLVRFESPLRELQPVGQLRPGEYLKLFLMVGAAIAVLARLQQLYRTDFLHSTLEESYAVAKVVTIATGAGLVASFFYDLELSRLTLPLFWALATVLIAALHALYRRWLVDRYRRGLDLRRTVVVGEPNCYLLHRLGSHPGFGVKVVGWLGERRTSSRFPGTSESTPVGPLPTDPYGHTGERPVTPPPHPPWPRREEGRRAGVLVRSAKFEAQAAIKQLPRLGAVEEAAAVFAANDIEQAVIVEHGLTHAELLEIIDVCEQRGVEVRLIPPIYDLLVQPSDFSFVEGVPLMRIDEARYVRLRQFAKRALDVVGSATLLGVLAPFLLAIAAAVKWTSPGPILFRQMRAGKGGRPFQMLKFRTMSADAEQRLREVVDIEALAEPVFKIAHDPRVTPVGRWLRRFSLDELPQLINVLKGDMSLVGPRPEELRIVERYDTWQRRRLKVKPGVTGLQQVKARGIVDLGQRVRLDIYYTRKQSLLLDFVILLKTVGVVLSGRGAT